MNILITGNTGFVGRHLTKKLLAEGHTIFGSNSSSLNLLKPLNYDSIPVKLDQIYHLACYVKAGTFNLYYKADIWEVNQLINTHIISYWMYNQPQATFITMGTSCAYPLEGDAVEENYLNGPLNPDVYGYAAIKRMLLYGLFCAAEQYELKFKYVIPNTINGPDFSELDSHFNFEFVKKICAGQYENKEVVLWGDGTQRRQIIDIADIIKILTTCEIYNKVVNISNGCDLPLSHYARIIAHTVGYDYDKIQWDTTKWSGNNRQILSNTYFKDYLWINEQDSLKFSTNYYRKTKYQYEMQVV